MTHLPEQVKTAFATLIPTGENELEIRFTPRMRLDNAGIATVIRERKRLCAGRPTGLLLIVPPDTELDLAILSTDHLKENQATDHVLGFAVVAGTETAETLLRLYKAYYPTPFEARVFTDEDEARTWLRARIAAASRN